MRSLSLANRSSSQVTPRATALFQESDSQLHKDTDRMFAYLLVVEWLAGIVAALWISPRAWAGQASSIHVHVWAALFLGGAISGFPIYLAIAHSGQKLTRHVIAAAQMLNAALLIHLTGGRIETHFQIFGVLAFLAFYRDWRVLLTATIVTAADHLIRGMVWPQSVYGILVPSALRWMEHAGWVIFEDVFLLLAIEANQKALLGNAKRRAELEAANANFERKVAERTQQLTEELAARRLQEEELSRTRDAALQAARLKAEFLANMSHEIRTPINGIIGMTGLMLDSELSSEQREFTEIIRSCGDSLLTLINDILDYSKIEADKLSLETLDFDARETLENVVEMLAERAQSKNLELVALVQQDVPTALRGDPGRLRQVLMNLIGNALKFTEKGEVVVHTMLESETEHEAILRCEVRDSGIGISKEGCNSLFQAFHQADGSTTRKYGGTGLGLAISKRLVEMMGGEIGVYSTLGVGSTFWFTIKLEKQLLAASQGPAAVDLSRVRVLIVDDNITNCRVVRLQLKARGICSEEAHSAAEALARMQAERDGGQPFDLVLLDMQMPVVDGLKLAQQIHADATLAATKVIMMTSLGNSDREREKLLKEAGVSICLAKPVKQSRLYDTMAVVMTGHTGRTAKLHVPDAMAAPSFPKAALAAADFGQPRAHILVAEDNSVNQKVILRQLANLGFRADAVMNGLEALNVLEQIKYDIVLMDCQMPEMDGYTAAREIRRRQKAAPGVHIIALTAHTLQGDREKCLEAGMDDFLSKPVKQEDLEQKLASWLLQRQAEPSAPAAESVSAELVDLSTMRQSAGEDPVFLKELLEIYLMQGNEQLAELRTAVQARRIFDIERLAHSLSGSSMCCGMRTIVPPLRRLESMARRGQLQDHATCLSLIEQEFERIQRFLDTSPLMAAA